MFVSLYSVESIR